MIEGYITSKKHHKLGNQAYRIELGDVDALNATNGYGLMGRILVQIVEIEMVFKVFVRNVIVTGKKHHKLGKTAVYFILLEGVCTKCHKYLRADEKNFSPRQDSADGFRSECRKCESSAKKTP
jgi:hypothetical protein